MLLLLAGVWFINVAARGISWEDRSGVYAAYLKGLLADIYGDPHRALGEYLKVTEEDNPADIDLRMALDYIKIKKYSRAVAILEKRRGAEPLDPDVYMLLVLVYTAWGKRSEAEAVYEEFLRRMHALDPENLTVAEALAELELEKGNLAAAEKIYLFLLSKRQKKVNIYLGLAYIYDEEKKTARAIDLLSEALKQFPGNPEVLNSLAYIYAEAGINLDKAEAMAKKALEIKPHSAAYLDSLGWVYYHKHSYRLAVKYLRQASELSGDLLIKEHLGDALYALGRYSEAIRCWRRIMKDLSPEHRRRVNEKIKHAENGQRRK